MFRTLLQMRKKWIQLSHVEDSFWGEGALYDFMNPASVSKYSGLSDGSPPSTAWPSYPAHSEVIFKV